MRNCTGQGYCILPDTCACYPAFDGKYCDQKAKPNSNSPSFDQIFYNATIIENSPVGTMIVQVHANDTDMGRNGQVFYTVVSNREIDDRLAIGGTSGKLYSTSKTRTLGMITWSSQKSTSALHVLKFSRVTRIQHAQRFQFKSF